MGWLDSPLDFVLCVLQFLALLFLAYGAYLATRRAGVRPALDEPSLVSVDAEKQLALEDATAPPVERRRHLRRRSDRRGRLDQNLETASASR